MGYSVLREGVGTSYSGVWISERTLSINWNSTPFEYLGGRRSGTFITI